MANTYWEHVAELEALPAADREHRLAAAAACAARGGPWADFEREQARRGAALAHRQANLEAQQAAYWAQRAVKELTPIEALLRGVAGLLWLLALSASGAALVALIVATWSVTMWALVIAAGVVLGGMVLGALARA